MITAIYPGSFDPVTNGHLDIIKRSAALVHHLYVGVLNNLHKKSLFSIEERIEMLKAVTTDLANVTIEPFCGLTIDFVRQKNANIIIRGLRAVTDFEYEFQMALTNKNLAPEVETLFISATTKYLYLTSSITKEIARYGGNIEDMVPPLIKERLFRRLEKEALSNGLGI